MSTGLWKTRYTHCMLYIGKHLMVHNKSNVNIYEMTYKTTYTPCVSTISKMPKDNYKYKFL
ncbi:hypothetical protein MA16_Dca025350 [Dendrobium catenatum]|uniref:Uncharacterized protein n=1 Tax=Dendrobium catenatum TaxID=906689 RepID=A0A2I0VFU9_9ASPA|nr:hypothetical protein MA16_Dca025350 [Dendrobium catenatum]